MTSYDAFEAPTTSQVRRLLPLALAALLAMVLGYFVWKGLTGSIGVQVDAPPPSTSVDLLPPPPPPPPPPPEEIKPPEPLEPTPELQTPTPAPETPAAMQIDGPAQAGADSYGMQSGTGGGMGAPGSIGTCIGPDCGRPSGVFSDSFYRRALASQLQEQIQSNSKLNRQVFSAEVLITVSPSGKVTAAEIVRSSGQSSRDDIITAALRSVEGLDAPPAGVRFPQRVTVRGRRSV